MRRPRGPSIGARPRPDAAMTRRQFIALAGATTAAGLGAGALLSGCPLPDPGYEATSLMAVQSIQDLGNSIPLIGGKRTIVRVFPATKDGFADVAGISGVLSLSNASGTLGTAPPLNGPISSRAAAAINPDRGDHSLDFEIPIAFLTGADLTVQCNLSAMGGATVVVNRTLSFLAVTRGFTIAPVLVQPTAYAAAVPTMADHQAVLDGVLKRLPVPLTLYSLRPPTLWQTNRAMTSGNDFLWICTDMGLHFFNLFGSDFPAAVIPAPPALPSGGYTDGMYYSGFAGAVLAFSIGGLISQNEGEGTFAHEFSHNYGLGHAAGCGAPAGIDGALPMTTDMTGMDVPLHTILPRGTSELMTYCAFPRWPSSATYTRVLARVL